MYTHLTLADCLTKRHKCQIFISNIATWAVCFLKSAFHNLYTWYLFNGVSSSKSNSALYSKAWSGWSREVLELPIQRIKSSLFRSPLVRFSLPWMFTLTSEFPSTGVAWLLHPRYLQQFLHGRCNLSFVADFLISNVMMTLYDNNLNVKSLSSLPRDNGQPAFKIIECRRTNDRAKELQIMLQEAISLLLRCETRKLAQRNIQSAGRCNSVYNKNKDKRRESTSSSAGNTQRVWCTYHIPNFTFGPHSTRIPLAINVVEVYTSLV